MAPPQVDLTKKQPLEDVQGWAETVGDQKLPPITTPPPVAVETGTKVAGQRLLARRRCKKLVIGMLIGAAIATVIVVGAFMIHRRHHHHHWKGHVRDDDGHDAEEHVRTEGSRRLIHIARNATNHFFGLMAVLDYETRLAGFKDCNRQQCYLDRLRESYEEGCERWRYYKKHARLLSERPLRVGPQVDAQVLEYIGGEEIFRVCGHLPSFWVLELTDTTPRDNTTQIIYL